MSSRLPKDSKLTESYRVTHGKGFRLKQYDPSDTQGLHLKDQGDEAHTRDIERLNELQNKLGAQDRWAVLLIFQAMDAGGKDSIIKHVMSGVNPQGCHVYSFKAPSPEDLSHDFLWRASKGLPARGNIGIFNRSYYEEVLIVRVHPDKLAAERLPESLVTKHIWKQRLQDIRAWEGYLHRNGTLIRKFFLHVSEKEQRSRFLSRLDRPDKNWKFSEEDVRERAYWKEYMAAYEEMIVRTASPEAPWYIVPADHKWFTRMVVASAIVEALESLNLAYPEVDAAKRKEIAAARKQLRSGA